MYITYSILRFVFANTNHTFCFSKFKNSCLEGNFLLKCTLIEFVKTISEFLCCEIHKGLFCNKKNVVNSQVRLMFW